MTSAAHVLAIVLSSFAPAMAAANDGVASARRLYAEASYERALEALDEAAAAGASMTAVDEQALKRFRALCLLALGRTSEAAAAVDELVLLNPLLLPDPADPPKLRTLMDDARSRLLPEIVRERYARGRALFERNAFPEAKVEFEAVLALLDGSGATGAAGRDSADLVVLSRSFLDLLRARTDAGVSPAPAAASDVVPGDAVKSPADVVAPVAIEQRVPPWPNALRKWLTKPLEGMMELRVGADGSVESATMTSPIHVAYDDLLLEAARRWSYHPALRDGKPVSSTKHIRIIIRPPTDPPGRSRPR